MSHFVVGILVGATLLAQADATRPPTAHELAAAAMRLGSDDFAEREAAAKLLWRAGKSAQPVLKKALQSNDLEAITRANKLLAQIRLGISPWTPPELTSLIETFPAVSEQHQHEILSKLCDHQQYETVLALVLLPADREQRLKFARKAVHLQSHLVANLMLAEENDLLGELLSHEARDKIENSREPRDYAAFLLQTDRLDGAIADLRRHATDGINTRLLARLLQVRGENAEGLALAKTTTDRRLMADLCFRTQDWKTIVEQKLWPRDGDSHLAYAATFQRLAGQDSAAEASLDSLFKGAIRNPELVLNCSAGLMLHGRWEQALEFFERKRQPRLAFDLRRAQLRLVEALHQAGVEDGRRDASSWFVERSHHLDPNSAQGSQLFFLALRVVETLGELGELEQALQLLTKTEEYSQTSEPRRTPNVIATLYRLGKREAALERTAQLLHDEEPFGALFYVLFSDEHSAASLWWQMLKELEPNEDRAVTFRRLRAFMSGPVGPELAAVAGRLIEQVDHQLPQPATDRLAAISEWCLQHNQPVLAERCLTSWQEVVSKLGSDRTFGFAALVPPLLRKGDLHAASKDWPAAARAYQEASLHDIRQAVPLYLAGHALVQAGSADEGRQAMNRALQLPLADLEQRRRLAETMHRLGLERQALDQWELILRFAQFERWTGAEEWAVDAAMRALGPRMEETDPSRAAHLRLRLFAPSGYLELEGYTMAVSLIHRTNALAQLKEGHTDSALYEIELARTGRPGDVELVVMMLPKLQHAGRTEAAEKLFADVYHAYDEVLRAFPNAASYHNDVASLAARCDRRLDEALMHARRAVELVPETVPHSDTLAEVLFRRGDHAKAYELAKRNLERQPANDHLRKQLKRFGTSK